MRETYLDTPPVSGADPDPGIAALLQAGRRHAELHTWDRAIGLYEAVLELAPDHPDAHMGLAELYRVREDPARAEPHYRAVLSAAPNRADVYLPLGDICRERGDMGAARAAYEQTLVRDTDPHRVARANAALAGMAEAPHSLCKRCGRFARLPHFRAAGSGRRKLCPQCFAATQGRRSLTSLSIYGAIIGCQLCGLALLTPDPRALLMIVANMLLFALTAYILLVPHELSHAVTGRMLGARIFEIRLGVGPRVWEGRIRRTRISLRRYPWAGFCVLGFPRIEGIRWRTMVTVLAGAAITALFVLLLLPAYDGSRLSRALAPLEVLVLAVGVQTIANLLPYKFHISGVAAHTDGATFLQLLLGRVTPGMLHLRYYLLAAQDAVLRRDPAGAAAISAQGLARYPDSTLLRNLDAITAMQLGDPARAVATFESLLASFNTPESPAHADEIGTGALRGTGLEAILLNNIAAARITLDGGASTPDLVRDYSRRAYELMPWHPAIESTWGSVLLFQGRPVLGLAYLIAALANEEDPSNRAGTLAYIALAHHRLGHTAEAGTYLAQATALDAGHYSLRQVRDLMGQEDPSPANSAGSG